MIKSYKTLVNEYGNQYRFDKAVTAGEIHKIEDGIYSDSENVSEVAILSVKYPHAIFTGDYAFYHYGLIDLIPEKYSLATKAKAARINDAKVHQIYTRDDILELGMTTENIDGCNVKMYDKERMLIELLRNKNSMPYDLYKEILLGYRSIIDNLQIWKIQEYADIVPKSKMVKKALDEEVM